MMGCGRVHLQNHWETLMTKRVLVKGDSRCKTLRVNRTEKVAGYGVDSTSIKIVPVKYPTSQ